MELRLYKLIMLPTMIVIWLASNGSRSSWLLRPSHYYDLFGKWVNGFRNDPNKRQKILSYCQRDTNHSTDLDRCPGDRQALLTAAFFSCTAAGASCAETPLTICCCNPHRTQADAVAFWLPSVWAGRSIGFRAFSKAPSSPQTCDLSLVNRP